MITDTIKESILNSATSGLRLQEIANRHSVSITYVRNLYKLHGTAYKPDRRLTSTHKSVDGLITCDTSQMSLKELATQFGLNAPHIRKVLKQHNKTFRMKADDMTKIIGLVKEMMKFESSPSIIAKTLNISREHTYTYISKIKRNLV